MAKLMYSAITSLDGYVEDKDGNFDWAAPDEEVHTFVNDLERPVGTYLYGRRMYETMVYWETADQDAAASEPVLEFARIWRALPKIVFSRSLEAVEGNTRLLRDGLGDEVARLKAQEGNDLGVGGAGLAGACARLGLIDEYRLFVSPVVLGGGTRFFPELEDPINLELVQTRTFSSRVVYLRYRLAS